MSRPKLPDKEFQWTPELAYVTGLLVTDGCLSNDGRHIIMRSSDIDLLETFRECLHLSNDIGETFSNGWAKKPAYRIQFGNVQFYRWLLKIGLFPAKTYTVGKIKVPNNFFRDFLRGHLDGDGSIITYQDSYNHYRGHTYVNQRVVVKFTSASRIHITWLYKQIKSLACVNGALIYKPNKKLARVPMWDIKFAKKESIKILQWIYYQPHLPSLKRKKLLAQQLIKTIPYEKRRPYTRIET